ncbi:BUD31-like, partial [Sigmodon hispidus]
GKAISRELYESCIKEGYADQNLIAKWKKQGCGNLCCLHCTQTQDTNFGTNCICWVPKSKLEVGRIIECTHCGCRGCSGWLTPVTALHSGLWTLLAPAYWAISPP